MYVKLQNDLQANDMKSSQPFFLRLFLRIYDIAWWLVIPFLRFSRRLKEGYEARCLKKVDFGKADIWIHAASAGESYLARQILKTLVMPEKLMILVTTNTSQGKEILEKPLPTCEHDCTVAYVPFDRPSLVRKAIAIADPGLLVLIESEIWPGLLSEMKKAGKIVIVVNGRMTEKSFSGYLKVPFLWPHLKPETILAISEDDRKRFATVFDHDTTFHVPNLKFDRMDKCIIEEREKSTDPFLVLASIRKEEEDEVLYLIEQLLQKVPNLQIGLFPRHMHRLPDWAKLLTDKKIDWELKSQIHGTCGAHRVILWDVFGELGKAYRMADAAFVGGSLAPLGGQNFIEAFMNGVIPVTGPHLSNFLWAGDEVFEEGLVKKGSTREEVVELLLETLENTIERTIIQDKANTYIASKQGGSVETCRYIRGILARV